MEDEELQSSYYATIPGPVLYDAALRWPAMVLYAHITSFAKRAGFCYAKNAVLLEAMTRVNPKTGAVNAITERTLQSLLAELRERGHIHMDIGPLPPDKNGVVRQGRRIFIGVCLADMQTGEENFTHENNFADGVKKISPSIITGINIPPYNPPKGGNAAKKRKNKSVPDWKPERFEKFWAFYRDNARGEDRAGAVREWDRLQPDDELIDTMAKAIQAQVATDEWKRGVGIPYACRWLKNERWKDSLRGAASQEAPAAPQRRYIGTKVVDGEEVDVYE